jgi:hypothetical protein
VTAVLIPVRLLEETGDRRRVEDPVVLKSQSISA